MTNDQSLTITEELKSSLPVEKHDLLIKLLDYQYSCGIIEASESINKQCKVNLTYYEQFKQKL